MTSQKEYGYAKINLFLDVEGIRADGFHEITTVMHTVSLSDELTVSIAPSRTTSITMQIDGTRHLPLDGKNLAARAAALFLEKAGRSADVRIKLLKRIPIAAGLAGGSTDAAAVLRAMNKLYRRPFTDKALLSMGAELGSDVPYCILGGTALCRGKGENMTAIPTELSLNTVIAVSDEHVSTPLAYKELDRIYSSFDGSVVREGGARLDDVLSGLSAGNIPSSGFYNIFESAILPACEGAARLKALFPQLGAGAALMSGSGPSVFGVFKTEVQAKAAEEKLRSLGYTACFAKTV